MKLQNLRTEFIKILHLDDTPFAIALSAAIGIFWNFIPTLGLGVFVSILFAKIFNGRVVVAATANLATGFFIPFFYTLNMITGRILTGFSLNVEEVEGKIEESIELSVTGIENVASNPKLYFLYDKIHSVSIDFVVGSIANAFLAAGLVYMIIWVIVTNKRKLKARFHKSK